jgi:uncharacterized protein
VAEMVLDRLRELQAADMDLRRLEQKKASHDRAAVIHGDQIRKHQEHIDALKGKHKQSRMGVDKKELDVRQKRADIDRLRGQQMQVKDNRQFSVLQNEIKFAELAISKLEDEILGDMADVEGAAAEVRKAEEELAKQQRDLEILRKEIAARKSDVDAEIAAGRARRDEVAKNLPRKAVDQFNRIADRLEGEALAPVLRDEEDEDGGMYICGGCHMSVTANTYVRLAGHGDDIVTCPNCTRILFLEES